MPPEVPRVRPSVEHVQIDDESLVFDGENLHRLTGAAHLVFMAVDGISTSEHIAAELATRHRTDLDRVREDVEATLAELTERDLVELIAAPSSPAYRISDHVAHTFVGGTVHVANLLTGARHRLSGTGAASWQLIAERATVDSVVSALRLTYPSAPEGRILADLDSLLGQLEEADLVRRVDG